MLPKNDINVRIFKKKQKEEKLFLKTQFEDIHKFQHIAEEAEDNFLYEFQQIMGERKKQLQEKKSHYPDRFEDWSYKDFIFVLRPRTSALTRLKRIHESFGDQLDAKEIYSIINRSTQRVVKSAMPLIRMDKIYEPFNEFNIKQQNYPLSQFYDFQKEEEESGVIVGCMCWKVPDTKPNPNHVIKLILLCD